MKRMANGKKEKKIVGVWKEDYALKGTRLFMVSF